ncbi:MAG TPA: hypothetical protein ENI26_09560, partial [Methylophaga aminisulfidivorans]|nr:hypothetical protein [Methylophaga aminisulfidivorans]
SEEGLSAKEATRKSMDQITGALVGIALVLSAVFIPMAFFGGSTGVQNGKGTKQYHWYCNSRDQGCTEVLQK